ncbi:MAG: molybdopterin oxidoreductase family protein [Lewinellaceae bacterium]|nr:molybdopterin oxidoreductase family protein [Lewinellaceae bacterium]
MPHTHYRACNLCEAICGIAITVDDEGQITTIAGDPADPLSKGHICPKAVALKDIYQDPNRLRQPLRRTPDGWETISWEEAFTEVVERLQAIRGTYGNDAVAAYQGNPSIHNLGTMMTAPDFFKALRTKNMFSATSTDQLPHHFASWLMFGSPMLLPVPDLDHTQYWMILGGNPLASNGSMMTAPGVDKRLRAIQERGGKVVVVDPRRTETAERADEHLFIRPGQDVYLLLGMVNTLFAENLIQPGRLAEMIDGLEELRAAVAPFTPAKMSAACGIPAGDIQRLARELAAAKSGVVYGRVGVSTQTFGGLCQWLINVLNILTGNFDRPGGAMFTLPALDFIARATPKNRFDRWRSRVRQFPEFLGELPVAVLAEEILTPGPGQIKALITSCGNPVLSTPNGEQLEQALDSLEFMVSIDIYLNETSRHAHLILPSATGLETSHYDITFHALAVRNTAKYSPALFPKAEEAKYDWEIYQELAHRLSGASGPCEPQPPEMKLDLGLRFGPYQLSLEQLNQNPHGIDLGPLKPALPDRLVHTDKRIQLAPPLLLNDLQRAQKDLSDTKNLHDSWQLIGRRHLRDNNSWMHNAHRLMRGRNRCTLLIHPDDALQLGVGEGDSVKVSSRVGSVVAPVNITTDIMPGVVSLPHGYGHHRNGTRLDVAEQFAGVSINDLTDDALLDELTGTAAFSNVRVQLEAV